MSATGESAVDKIARELERQERELSDLNNLLIDKQGDIDEYDRLISELDKKVVSNTDSINVLYQNVADAYENRISIGCSSGLQWRLTGISTNLLNEKIYTYVCEKTPLTCFNKYGLQCLKKPVNREYDINIISEISGTVAAGSTILIVNSNYGVITPDVENPDALYFEELTDIRVGDFVTDDTENPIIFSEGSLPTVVGFGSTVNAFSTGIKTSFTGDIISGTTIIAIRNGSVFNLGLEVGDYIHAQSITSNQPSKEYSKTKIVGFGTTSITFDSYYADTGIGQTTAVTEAVIIDTPAVGSASTQTFVVGVGTEVPSIIMSSEPVGIATNKRLTFIRNTELYTQFPIDKNPLENTVVGVIEDPVPSGSNSFPPGTGSEVILINNGAENVPDDYNSLRASDDFDGSEKKPNVGAGQVCYREGTNLWPYINFAAKYAEEGDILTLSGISTNATYTLVPPASSGCSAAQNQIDQAVQSLEGADFSQLLSNADFYISSSNTIRESRQRVQLEAWSVLQAINELQSKRNKLISAVNIIKDPNFDLLD